MRAKISAIAASTWQICIIAVALIVVSTCSAIAGKTITKINVTNKAERTVITVQGNEPLKMMPFSSSAGRYLGFQFPTKLGIKSHLVGVHNGAISCVKYTNFRSNPPCSRIVVNTSARLQYSTQWSQDKKQVEISIWKKGFSSASVSDSNLSKIMPACEKTGFQLTALPPLSSSIDAPAVSVEPAVTAKNVTAPLARLSDESRKVYAALRSVGTTAKAAHQMASARPQLGIAETQSREPKDVQLTVLPPLSNIVPSSSIDAPAVSVEPEVKAKNITAPLARLSDESRKVYAALRSVGTTAKAAYQMASARPQITSRVMGMVETEGRQPDPIKITTRSKSLPVLLAQATTPVKSEKRVSLNFLGADINDVLKALSLQSGENIVASKDVKGEVTVSLSNVNMEEALDYITNPNGFSYVKNNETYLVTVKNNVVPEVVSTNVSEVFALHYAKSDEIIGILEKLFPDLKMSGGKSSKPAASGSSGAGGAGAEGGDSATKDTPAKVIDFIVVSAPAERMVEIRNVVKQLEDSIQSNMALLKTEVYTVKYADPKTIAEGIGKLIPGVMVGLVPVSTIELYNSGNVDATITGGAIVSKRVEQDAVKNPVYQSLVLSGPAEQVVRAVALATQLDVKPAQISIEAKITSINKSGEAKLGLKWNWGTDGVTENGEIGFAETGIDAWARQALGFKATLNALVVDGNIKILASPNLLCLDGMPGLFFVGDEVTYIERIETTPTGQNIKTQTKQVGVQLRVVGKVSSDGYITLNLHPEVSTLKLTPQQGVNLPVLSRRYTDHVVRVKNGQTIAIGGLIRNDEIKEMTKVPLLGDLPFFGKLFQHKSKSNIETEVVMFITAKVVED